MKHCFKLLAFSLFLLNVSFIKNSDFIKPYISIYGTLYFRDVKFINAITQGDLSKIKELIETGSDINHIFYDSSTVYYTPLHIACKKDDCNIIKFLIEKGADLNIKDQENRKPFQCIKSQETFTFYHSLINKTPAHNNLPKKDGMPFDRHYS